MVHRFTFKSKKPIQVCLLLIGMLGISLNAHAVSDTVCAYTDSHLYTTPYDSGHSYQWSVQGGKIVSGQNTDSIRVNWHGGNDTGVIKLTETNLSNCDSTVRDSIYIAPKPSPSITGKDTVCAFTSGHAYTTSSKSGYNYKWTVSGGTITSGSGTDSITVDWQGTDSGNVQLKTTNASGCDTTVNKPIHIDPKPAPAISGKDTVCEFTSPHAYTTSGGSGHSYSWTVTGGTIQSGAGTDSITVQWSGSGSGTVQLKETNASNCDTTVTKDIHIDPKPAPAISGKDTVCEFTGGHGYSTAAKSGYTYSWTVNGGTVTSGSGTDSITVKWQGSGSGTVKVKTTNSAGCDTTVSKNIHIDPKPSPAISGKDTICTNATTAYTTTGSSGSSYNWTVSGGTIQSGKSTDSITVNWGSSGSGTVKLKQTNAEGCDTTVTKDITIDPKPTPVIQGQTPICEGSVTAYYVNSDTTHTFSWSVSGGTITKGSGTDSITVEWGGSGNGTVNLTETNNKGCDTSVSKNINIDPKPEPVIQGFKEFCEGEDKFVYLNSFDTDKHYKWQVIGGHIVNDKPRDTIHIKWSAPEKSGAAMVTAQNQQGCFNTDTHDIQVRPKPKPSLDGPVELCANASAVFYNTNDDSSQLVDWTITGGNVQKKRTA